MKNKLLIPNAPILIESIRSVGYSFESAMADIVDNSIGKNAKRIDIYFDILPSPYVAIVDDACGMSNIELEIAMQYGSKSSLEERDSNDLGRFGLGLKTASLSQCRRLTVITKRDGIMSAAQWDIDHIIKMNSWSLLEFTIDEIKNMKIASLLDNKISGTIVLWECFDRLESATKNFSKLFNEKISLARSHIALVFHRFIGDESISNKVKIYFNNEKVSPIDPFLSDNPATQPLNEQIIKINNEKIKVKPYILPYPSKLSAKDKKKLGDINDLRQSQGFYVYRNKRLIIWGTWFRLIKNYELNKLARIRVDIPNSLDSIWEIDIKKSTASLPDIIKQNLVAIVEKTVGKSEKVYRYRGRKINNDDIEHIWNVVNNRGKYEYLINRDTILYKKIISCLPESDIDYFDSFIKMIEDSFPYSDVYYRIAKNEIEQNTSSLEFEEAYKIAKDMIRASKDSGMDNILETMSKMDFFVNHKDVLEKLKGECEDE